MRLLFVYNADGDLGSRLIDAAHKVISPATYPCGLCAITYGPLGMRPAWQAFVDALPVPVAFLHREAFHARYGDRPLPAVLFETDEGRLDEVVPASGLVAGPDPEADLERLMQRVATFLERRALTPRGGAG